MTSGNGRARRERVSAPVQDDTLLDVDIDAEAAVDTVIQECSQWMAARLDEVVAAITRRMTGAIPIYERSARDHEGRELLRANVERIVRRFVMLLVERRRLTVAEREHIESVGALRAAGGFPLDAIQEGAHVAVDEGLTFLHRALLGAGDDLTALTAAHEIGRLVQHAEFDIQRALEAGFRRARDDRVVSEARTRDALLRRVLERGANDLRLEGTSLGSFATASCIDVVVARPLDGEEGLETVAGEVGRIFGERAEGPVLSTVPTLHSTFILCPDPRSDRQNLSELARTCRTELVVEPANGIPDLARAYAVVRDLLPLVPARDQRCVRAVDLLHLPLLWAAPRAQLVDYMDRLLGPAFARDPAYAQECLETLLAYYDSPGAQAKQAAYARNRHEKTAANHLRRAEELTGCGKDGDRLRLEIAVRIWDHLRRQPPQPGDPLWLASQTTIPQG